VSTDFLGEFVVVAEATADGGPGGDHTAGVLLLLHLEPLVLGVTQLRLGVQQLAVVELVRLHRLHTSRTLTVASARTATGCLPPFGE